ncbi:uncharacterized protein NEMAJ01_0826 [Nematocida major]|uniref:uncharacterized protein n=1 Tax=Nematocida major TaxID=1912982 RepID=UPI002008B52F|nr:uncharacterized protein NEMAJ01_0826 [Nematocida major]KAH9385930.1 hypothetical protein NEMAJ01_0826 [Nematocida major]
MGEYRVVSILDITQPLLNHEETGKVPSVCKAVVERTENSKKQHEIVYIETEGIEIGVGAVFTYASTGDQIIRLSKTKIQKKTRYRVDNSLIGALLSKTKKVDT